MGVGRRKRIKRNWSVVFEEFDHSDMPIKEFCQVKGISQSLFYRNRKDYRDIDLSSKPSLERGDFVELQRSLPPTRLSASIIFGSQIELSISNDCDKELLRSLISQLKNPPC